MKKKPVTFGQGRGDKVTKGRIQTRLPGAEEKEGDKKKQKNKDGHR